jgi:hypothetical protein
MVSALQFVRRMLKREVLPRPSGAAPWLIGAILVGVVGAGAVQHRVSKMFGESKYEVARHTVDDIAARGVDPWGNAYRIYSSRGGVVVHSLGEDGVPNTVDDLWSNR